MTRAVVTGTRGCAGCDHALWLDAYRASICTGPTRGDVTAWRNANTDPYGIPHASISSPCPGFTDARRREAAELLVAMVERVTDATGISDEEAERRLRASNYNVECAIRSIRAGFLAGAR